MSSSATTTTGTTTVAERSAPSVPAWTLVLSPLITLLLLIIASQLPDGRLHMWVLDVGQGDAILLRTPGGHTALVDGGPGATAVLNSLGSKLPFWQHNIDLVVLTHPHEDHLMGLVDVLARYRVGEVVETQFTATAGVQGEWLRQVASKNVPVHYARRGEEISFEGEPGLVLRVLSPVNPDALRERQGGDINNSSVVLKLDYGNARILLEGDAQLAAEGEMAAHEAPDLRAAVLKVGHHGSSTSSSPGFLAKVRPSVAIISVGSGNKFGQPATQTLDALRVVGAQVYRTDERGTVEIIAEKDRMWVKSER